MLYLIGLGLNSSGISIQGVEAAKRCKKIYLESYTVDFPYTEGGLQELFEKKIIKADREKVENMSLIDEAIKQDVALLVYGSPLTATTHISLIQEAKASGVKYKIIYAASILDAVAETGLQLYKFGKITSMPSWKKSYEPTSFMEVVKDNAKIEAHTLILIDIGLELNKALEQLEISSKKEGAEIGKVVLCSQLGTNKSRIYYESIDNLKKREIEKPYCLIIPGKMHFLESDFLENLRR